MKILVVSPIVKPEIGGPATYVEGLTKELKKQKGCEVGVVAFQSGKDWKYWAGRKAGFFRVPTRGGIVRRQGRLGREIWKRARKVDLIYVLDPLTVGVAAAVVGRLKRVPVVARFVGDVGWEVAASGGRSAVSLDEYLRNGKGDLDWRFWLQKWVLRSSAGVVVPSEYLRELLVRFYGVAGERVEVVRNAVGVLGRELGSGRGLLLRNESCGARKKKQVVGVGRLMKWKNFDVLIRAFAKIQSRGGWGLIIVGDGPERENLGRLAGELGVGLRVRFLGRLSQERTWRVVEESAVLALPSSYEGMSHVLLEAMALGVPVVASDIEANREVVEKGKTGLLFPVGEEGELAECLVRLLEKESLAKKLVGAAKREIGRYNWGRHVGELERAWKKIVS